MQQHKEISKLLSYVLRHQPQHIKLNLNQQGWVNVQELIEKLKATGTAIDLTILEEIVSNNDKQRFAFNEDKTMIRASQGHSVTVDLNYQPQTPPAILYHGTTQQNLPAIMENGIAKMSRHHVHLSTVKTTALQVGQRHGKAILLAINALKMHEKGHLFYQSDNGVWLTDTIPPEYIAIENQ